MVSVSAARSIHEYGDELIIQQGQPEVDSDCEIKYLVPWEEEQYATTPDSHKHHHHDVDPHEHAHNHDHLEDERMTVVPYFENGVYKKRLVTKAVFDVPTRKIFTIDLLNKKSSRYYKEAEKLKNVFLVEMASVDLDQKFVGLDITFYDQKDHTHSHRYGHRIGCLKIKLSSKINLYKEVKSLLFFLRNRKYHI